MRFLDCVSAHLVRRTCLSVFDEARRVLIIGSLKWGLADAVKQELQTAVWLQLSWGLSRKVLARSDKLSSRFRYTGFNYIFQMRAIYHGVDLPPGISPESSYFSDWIGAKADVSR